MADVIGALVAQIGGDTSDLEAAQKHSKNVLGSIGQEFQAMGRIGAGAFRFVRDQIFSLQGALAAAGLGVAAKDFVDAASSAEQLTASLDRLTGGRGVETFRALDQWAAKLPVDTNAAIETYKNLVAMGLRPTLHEMELLVDASAALGGGSETVKGLALAIGQMATKGKPALQELYQLAGRGVPVFKILEEQLGMTGEAVSNIATSGRTAQEVIDALYRGLEKLYGGASQDMASSWAGLIEQTKDTWTKFQRAVMDAGVFEFLKSGLAAVVEQFEKMKAAGDMDRLSRDMATAIITAFTYVARAAAIAAQSIFSIKFSLEEASQAAISYSIIMTKVTRALEWLTFQTERVTALTEQIQAMEAMGAASESAGKQAWDAMTRIGTAADGLIDQLDSKLNELSRKKYVGPTIAPIVELPDLGGEGPSARKAAGIGTTPYGPEQAPMTLRAQPAPVMVPARRGIEEETAAVEAQSAAYRQAAAERAELVSQGMSLQEDSNAQYRDLLRAREEEERETARVTKAIVDDVVRYEEEAIEARRSSWDSYYAHQDETFQDWRAATVRGFDRIAKGVGDAFAEMLVDGKSWAESMRALWTSLVKAIISRLVEMTAVYVTNSLVRIAQGQVETSAAVTQGAIQVASRSGAAGASGGPWGVAAAIALGLAAFAAGIAAAEVFKGGETAGMKDVRPLGSAQKTDVFGDRSQVRTESPAVNVTLELDGAVLVQRLVDLTRNGAGYGRTTFALVTG